jgi:GNAT superfamily N-acetyltransferase
LLHIGTPSRRTPESLGGNDQMDDVEIREAQVGDAAAITGLSGELGYPSSTSFTEERLQSLLGTPANGVFVAAANDGSVLGWIHVYATHFLESDPFAELGGFVVTAPHRGRGIGKQLLAEAEQWAARYGLNKIKIRSRSTRIDAHAFYERTGYSIDKTQHVFEKLLEKKP